MKKERKSRNLNKQLYFAFDHYYGYDCEDENCRDEINNILKRNKVEDYDIDTRKYGLFKIKGSRIKLDPKRYNRKMFRLDENIKAVTDLRNGPYYYPSKIGEYDYECNIFVEILDSIIEEWSTDFKPMISEKLSKIKSIEVTAIDDNNFMCGITGPNSANANAMWANMKNAEKDANKKEMLYTSFIAQFFHLTMSRVEAMAVASITRKGWVGTHFDRNEFVRFAGINKDEVCLLQGFKAYTQSYCIWNFIKHNSMSTYESLKKEYPEIIYDGEYKQGYLAIKWISLTEEVMLDLINGIKVFYIDYCKLVYDEDYDRAQWDYDYYFSRKVASEIELIVNPLGLGAFDDLD